MAMSVFGPAVDVHAGGAELRFPHHAYHAAMAEAFTGVHPYARAWFHTGVVTVDGAKMAKSAGNLVLVGDLLAEPSGGRGAADDPGPALGTGLDYRPELLGPAADPAGIAVPGGRAAGAGRRRSGGRTARLLATDLDVPAALDLATEAGGAAARTLASVLGLT